MLATAIRIWFFWACLFAGIADLAMLFNEAEVLAAIEAAEQAERQRTRKVGAHERQHTGGRKAIPMHFPRIGILHDLPEAQGILQWM